MARVFNIVPHDFVAFFAAVKQIEFSPPRLHSRLQIALTLIAISVQTTEIHYSGRLAVRIALWLVNGAYFRRKWPPDSRNTLFWPAARTNCAVARKLRILGRKWHPDSRNTLFWQAGLTNCAVACKRRVRWPEIASRFEKYAIMAG